MQNLLAQIQQPNIPTPAPVNPINPVAGLEPSLLAALSQPNSQIASLLATLTQNNNNIQTPITQNIPQNLSQNMPQQAPQSNIMMNPALNSMLSMYMNNPTGPSTTSQNPVGNNPLLGLNLGQGGGFPLPQQSQVQPQPQNNFGNMAASQLYNAALNTNNNPGYTPSNVCFLDIINYC